jgi:hypothetical protein
MKFLPTVALLLTPFLGAAFACSSTKGSGFDNVGDGGGPNLGGEAGLGLFDDATAPTGLAVTLTGKVFAPNGTLPLAGTLVYVSDREIPPIPQGTYCDKCVELPDGTFTLSKADGTFSLPTRLTTGKHTIVTQKGQFRRVREFEVTAEGEIKIPAATTTLPGRRDMSRGDDTPRMVILKSGLDFDKIEESLTKLGIQDVEIQNSYNLTRNAAQLKQYHVVFIPCDTRTPAEAQDSGVQNNLRDFVNSGGKLYVTDWSYEWVRQPFGGFIQFEGGTGFGAATVSEYDGAGAAVDGDLDSWLKDSARQASFTLKGNYTRIGGVNMLPGKDADGKDAVITPKVWMNVKYSGRDYPSTVSFGQTCGRVLFSTYHTEGGFGGSGEFLPQEMALLYVLLEVSTCAGQIGGPR